MADCCIDLTARAVVDSILPALGRFHTRTLRHVVVVAAGQCLREHRGACAAPPLADDEVVAQLEKAYDAAAEPRSLDETIAALVAEGLDGERITWEVISRESVKHEGLIHKECNRLVRSLPDRSAEDLKGYGWVGLRVALRLYDPSLGFAFSTYACPRINGAIRDGVRAESPIPKRLTTFVRKVGKIEETLTHHLARTPTFEEVRAHLAASAESLHLLPRLAAPASIEEMSLAWGEKTREPACLVDADDPQAAVMISMRDAALHAAVDALPADEAQAVRLLMLEEVPVGEAAALVGIEVRQLRARKVRGMRALAPVMQAWLDDHEMAVA